MPGPEAILICSRGEREVPSLRGKAIHRLKLLQRNWADSSQARALSTEALLENLELFSEGLATLQGSLEEFMRIQM